MPSSARCDHWPPRVLELRAELPLPGHLLEQPPSLAVRRAPGKWCDHVGQPAPVVLAVISAARHAVDGRESLCAGPYGIVWSDPVTRGDRVSADAAHDSPPGGPRLDTGGCRGQ